MTFVAHGGVALPLPDGWRDETILVARGPASKGFTPVWMAVRAPTRPNESLEQLAARVLPKPKKRGPVPKRIKEGKVRLGAHLGVLRQHTLTAKDRTLLQTLFVLQHGGEGYLLTHVADADTTKPEAVEQLFAQVKLGELRHPQVTAGAPRDQADFF